MSKRAKRGVAAWCEANGIEPGAKIEICFGLDDWVPARVTAVGESAILIRRPKCAEFSFYDAGRVRTIPSKESVCPICQR